MSERQCKDIDGKPISLEKLCRDEPAWAASRLRLANGLIWYAWSEFNAIRARDGAPEGVEHEYWDKLTESFRDYIGDDAQPWPSADTKSVPRLG